MYITYETSQYSQDHFFSRHIHPPRQVPDGLPRSEFMPSKLVRISDMNIVDGSQVNEGYCALSYSWNQSGDIQQDKMTEKSIRVDEGKHKIVSYDTLFPDMIIPFYKHFQTSQLYKIKQILQIMDENHHFPKTTKYVKFEGIIQQICKDFNIKYIWFDQMCINQDNKEEKHRELRKMHNIYDNAYCTVALVPEYHFVNPYYIDGYEEYFSRLWTLEEAIKSKRLVFVGKDMHVWGENIPGYNSVSQLIKPLSDLKVHQILYYAHQRKSTKDHDRVFALIHLFPEFMDQISIDYDQPLEDLMIQFYGLLAKKDISILFFKKCYDYEFIEAIQKYKFLPSWTGAHGQHKKYTNPTATITTSFQNYSVIQKTMHLTSTFIKNDRFIDNDSFVIQREDLPPSPDDVEEGDNKVDYRLCVHAQVSGTSKTKIFQVTHYHYADIIFHGFDRFDQISNEIKRLSRFMEIKMETLCWCHKKRDDFPYIDFTELTDDLVDSSTQYMIISGILFNGAGYDGRYKLYSPVIKKGYKEKYFKATGCCTIDYEKDVFSDCNLPTKTFLIQ